MTLSDLLSLVATIYIDRPKIDVMDVPLAVRLPDGSLAPLGAVEFASPPDEAWADREIVFALKPAEINPEEHEDAPERAREER